MLSITCLNFFLKKIVSKRTVKGIIASFVIYKENERENGQKSKRKNGILQDELPTSRIWLWPGTIKIQDIKLSHDDISGPSASPVTTQSRNKWLMWCKTIYSMNDALPISSGTNSPSWTNTVTKGMKCNKFMTVSSK